MDFEIEIKKYLNGKFILDIEDMFDPFKLFDRDGAIAKKINMESRDYIFFMAKYGKAQKGEESQYLYWDNEDDAQCAIDWITQYLIMKKLSS